MQPKKQNVEVRNGDEKVMLECVAFGARISWERRDGETIPSKAILREGSSILEIPNARSEDSGDYRCVAENSAGRSMSKYAEVSVTGENQFVVSRKLSTSVT